MRFLIVMIALAVSCGVATAQETRQIAVTGRGEAEAVPDMAVISMGVTTEAREADAAMDANSARVAAMIEALGRAGVEEADIRTSRLTLAPRFAAASSSDPGSGRAVAAFVATNTVTVRVRALEGLGRIMDLALEAGANRFHGLSFGFANPAPLRDEARREAVRDARHRAELYAQAAGVALGRVLTISEAGGGAPRPVMMEAATLARAGDVPVAPGEATAEAAVTVVYELADPE